MTDEWLNARLLVTAEAAKRALASQILALVLKQAGEAYASGDDRRAQIMRNFAGDVRQFELDANVELARAERELAEIESAQPAKGEGK